MYVAAGGSPCCLAGLSPPAPLFSSLIFLEGIDGERGRRGRESGPVWKTWWEFLNHKFHHMSKNINKFISLFSFKQFFEIQKYQPSFPYVRVGLKLREGKLWD